MPKKLDFLRSNFRILAGLRAPTRTLTDACEEGKSQFPIGKRSYPYKNSESCRKDLRDWSK